MEIAASLRCFHHTESVLLAGHRKVRLIVAGDLEEDAGVGSALVRLAGGVQEARAKSQTGGDTFLVAHRSTNILQRFFVPLIHFHVGQQGEVISGLDPAQVCAQIARQRFIVARRRSERGRVLFIGEQMDAVLGKDG